MESKTELPKSLFSLARMKRERATREAAATMADEFTFAGSKIQIKC